MPALVTSIDIDRPPEAVYPYVTDPGRFPEWQPDVLRVQVDGDRPLGIGARFTTIRRLGGVQRAMVQEVTAAEPGRRWAVRGVGGAIRPSAGITVEPLDRGTRSRVTFTLDFEGHGIGVPLAPAVRRMAARGAPASYQRLKRLLERDG